MEQLYLIEIFIDKVYIFAPENESSGANKSLIIKVKFGPSVQFIIKEGQLAKNENQKDDIIECDENGHRKWCRTIRVGKSYLFPSYSDTVLLILEKFPLEIEVWNDDENENEIYVGIGTMYWDTEFYLMLKETANNAAVHTPLSIKQVAPLMAECCCKQCGEISLILRITALGNSIVTEFQQLMKDPDSFVFRTNKAPGTFQCKRIEGDDPNFCMVGTLYETTTLEDPEIQKKANEKIEVCTELQSCGNAVGGSEPVCQHSEQDQKPKKKKYPIDKIRMGDIHGPCGNSNCPLAHKVRQYIRNLDAYKRDTAGRLKPKDESNTTKKVCGGCSCKDDRYHRTDCPESKNKGSKEKLNEGPKTDCSGCGGVVPTSDTCEDRKNNLFGTGATPKGSKTHVAYVFNVHQVPGFSESVFGRNFIEENLNEEYSHLISEPGSCKPGSCGCRKHCMAQANHYTAGCGTDLPLTMKSVRSIGTNNPTIYNVEVNKESTSKGGHPVNYQQCLDNTEEKDCKCNPPKPSPPCKTFDCDCIAEIGNIASRKAHKAYCPLYKHKVTCPVTMLNEEEENHEDDEDVAEPLPYGLPPIQLGPCPIIGRPCSVPDGFARMYKNAVQPTLPASYDHAGKVCCSKEYERIKKSLKDYIKHQKENDFRCLNKFNVDTERRCCDKEQRLLSLMGKGCCGSHKMAIQEEFKDDKKK